MRKIFAPTMMLLLILVACGGRAESDPAELPAVEAAQDHSTETPAATSTPEPPANPTTEPESEPEVERTEIPPADERPVWLQDATRSWNTDWTQATIDYSELLGGGPPRDGIPSIDEPLFISSEEAAEWLQDNEPVIALEINDDARAYPLQILTWHEIANDVVGGVPVMVTFCPLCNSAVVFERTLPDGRVTEFGVSGLLRNSDLVMYDRETESLWQQLTGQGIVGEFAGEDLAFVPASLVSFADFREFYPEGVILSRETGHIRSYGRNPYVGYDTIGRSPFLYDGEEDGRLEAVERVVTVFLNGVDVAYPYSVLAESGAINDQVAGQDIVVLHSFGTASALGAAFIAQAQDVGATGVFDPYVDGQKLSFYMQDDTIKDVETNSTWNVLGLAIDGPLSGERLTPILHGDHFWFAWAAFKPETIVYQRD